MAPVIPLKYPKSEKANFLTPHFFNERNVMYGHMRVILIALDELYNICFNAPFYLQLSTYLVQKTKYTIFDRIKVPLFPEQCWVILVYSCRALVEIYKIHTLSTMIPHTPTM
jgi:hypothetical protein